MKRPLPILLLALMAAASLPPAMAWAQGAPEVSAKPAEAAPDYGTLIKPTANDGASRREVVSAEAAQVGMDESVLGDTIPMTLPLIDEKGDTVTLAGLCGGARPVVLQLGYYRCPVICSYVLGNLAKQVGATPDLRPGRDFEVVSVSIDPKETAVNAKESRVKILGDADATGWHFLTASEASIKGLAAACGFRYRYIASVNQYAHPGTVVFLSPQGKVTEFLDGQSFQEPAWRAAVAGAKSGTVITPPADNIFAQCSAFIKGAIPRLAQHVMMLGGGITVITMVALFFFLRRLESRKRAAPPG